MVLIFMNDTYLDDNLVNVSYMVDGVMLMINVFLEC